MTITINEIFHSLQGEGVRSGIPTTFIRVTGCNLRCNWCDTIQAYDDGEEMELEAILEEVRKLRDEKGHPDVCITGGEPLLQEEVPELVHRLLSGGFQITLETNGSRSLASLLQAIHQRSLIGLNEVEKEGTVGGGVKKMDRSESGERFLEFRERFHISLDVKCPSSGESEALDIRNFNLLSDMDQLKFVVEDRRDLEFALETLWMHPVFCPTIIQPVMGGTLDRPHLQEMARAFLDSVPGDRDVRFMIQSHKVIWGDRTGV